MARHKIFVVSSFSNAAPKYTTYDSHSIPMTNCLPFDSSHYNHNILDEHTNGSLRSRHSPRLRDKAYTKSDVAFRDRFAFLASKRTVPTSYRPFPGPANFVHGSGLTKLSAERELLSLIPCGESDASDDPFTSPTWPDSQACSQILAPIVCVTPDTRVIDMGCHNLWVAVEVAAILHRPEDEDRNSLENITRQLQASTHPDKLGEFIRNRIIDNALI